MLLLGAEATQLLQCDRGSLASSEAPPYASWKIPSKLGLALLREKGP